MEISTDQFIEEMKKIQKNLLDYLDIGDNIEGKYQNLINIFDEFKFHDNQFKIKPLLYLILNISNNHHRESEFFTKIEKILILFKEDMKKYFSNNELFHIFKSNKRLLLFLFEENIMIMNESIVNKIISKKYLNLKYPQYFQPEIQPFINEEWFPKYDKNNWKLKKNGWVEEINKKLPDDFYIKRKIGENDNEICKYIQKDLIEEFIIYIHKNNYSIKSTIESSIYETNDFLIEKNKNITLIEYAAFFGSIQIFKYLRQNEAELNSFLWIYAVHSQNPEIINFLEENRIFPPQNVKNYNENLFFEEIFYESIKCHHIDIAYYIQEVYLQNKKENSNDTLINGLKYYNFMFIQCEIDNENSLYYLCKYDYYSLVFILFYKLNIKLNKKIIYIVIFYAI